MLSPGPPRRRGAPALVLAAALLLQGCGLVSGLHLPSFRMPSVFGGSSAKTAPGGAASGPDATLSSRGAGATRDPVFMYLQLAMLSDRVVSNVIRETADPLEETEAPRERESLLRLRLDLATALWNAASGPNPYANAIDMMVTIDVARRLLNGPSLTRVLGDDRGSVDQVLAAAGGDVRTLVRDFLSPAEFTALESAIASADTSKYDSGALDTIDLQQLLSSAQSRSPGQNTGLPSLLGILGVDPLASLDPATREIAETRQFGERMLFSVQRLPYLLRMNGELLANDVAQGLDVDKAVDAVDRASLAMSKVAGTVEGLPDRISQERRQLVADLGSESARLGALARDWHGAFDAATGTATATNQAIQSFDVVAKRMEGPPGATPAPGGGDSLDVKEIGRTAAGVGDAAANLTTLLARLQQTLETPALERVPALAGSVVGEAEATARRLLWTAFGLGCLLVAIACVAAILTSRLLRRPGDGSGR